jgi:tripartite-type tricarboxylate transporter receptor subunit TctC
MKKLILLLLLATNLAYAEKLEILVGFPPGGGQHTIALIIEEALRSSGHETIVNIKSGAGGVIAMNECVKRAEFNVLCLASQSQLVYTDILSSDAIRYQPEQLTYIKLVGESPLVLLSPITNTKSIPDVMEDIRLNKVTFGSGALGNSVATRQLMSFLKSHNAIDVNYKGVGPAIVDLMGNHIDYVIAPYAAAKTQIDQKSVRLVASFEKKSSLAGVQVFPKFAVPVTIFGFVGAPTMTSNSVKFQESLFNNLMENNTVRQKFKEQGIFISDKNLTGSNFKKMVIDERQLYASTPK